MEKFTVLTGAAAPLLRDNINTDAIIRIERLMAYPKGQLGPYCFEVWRYRPDGTEDPTFVLNREPYRDAAILIAGANFGCGSSREQAVWALADLGFRCVIAPSFGDIFLSNCFQNGVLPVVLPAETVADLAAEAESRAKRGVAALTVDLQHRRITSPSGLQISFEVDPVRRQALLDGVDELGMTLQRAATITQFQEQDRSQRPWIYQF